MKNKIILSFLFLLSINFSLLSSPSSDGVYRGETLTEKLSASDYQQSDDSCRIFLIRHAETEWNVEGKSQGWNDIPLNEVGLNQALALAENLSDIPLAAVYTSILSRATETAHMIANYHPDCQVMYDATLRFYDPANKKPPGLTKEEAKVLIAEEITTGVLAYLKTVSQNHKGQNVILLTHGKVIKHLVRALENDSKMKVKIGNAALVEVIGNGEELRLVE